MFIGGAMAAEPHGPFAFYLGHGRRSFVSSEPCAERMLNVAGLNVGKYFITSELCALH